MEERIGKFATQDIKKAEALIHARAVDIVEKWNARFIYGRDIVPERIFRLK